MKSLALISLGLALSAAIVIPTSIHVEHRKEHTEQTYETPQPLQPWHHVRNRYQTAFIFTPTVPSKPHETKPKKKAPHKLTKFITYMITAYTNSIADCGNTLGITASGKHVKAGTTISCPPTIPLGTKVNIKGYGTYTCQDRGGAIQGKHIDLYVKTEHKANQWGVKYLPIYIIRR